MSSLPKPSDEADLLADASAKFMDEDIIIHGHLFATSEDVISSLKESRRKTEIWTLTDRLNSLEKSNPIPILKGSNWSHYYKSVEQFIFLSQTSAAFLHDQPRNRAIIMWKSWWVSKLRETAPNVRTSPSDSPKEILTEIFLTSQAQAHNKIITLTSRFWMFQPEKNSTIQGFIKEYQRRFYDLK